VGTEYRDFVYGFENFSRDRVLSTGYDWLGSTLATLTPGFIANALGINKAELVVRDSARSLMPLWNVQLGIRIGLPGELWFAYGWYAVALFFVFGALIMGISNLAARSVHYVYKAIFVTMLGILALSVIGQSTVTFGLILPLGYLAIAVAITERVTQFRVRGPRVHLVQVSTSE